MAFSLRPYQQQAIDAIQSEWRRGNHATLIILPTGVGKTEIYLWLMNAVYRPGQRWLYVAHRNELLRQPARRLEARLPRLCGQVGFVRGREDQVDSAIVFASIQTLVRPQRIERLLKAGKIDYLFTDEAHHAPASQYLELYRRLKAANPHLRHAGGTATPDRLDGKGLGMVYDSVACQRTIPWGIRKGYLVPIKALRIHTRVDISDVRVRGGDFVSDSLSQVINVRNRNQLIVEAYQKYTPNALTIAFCASVTHAEDLAAAFRENGVTAQTVSGRTAKDRRRHELAAFQEGNIRVMTNCEVLTEGFDAPAVSAVLLTRPTQSQGLYIQMSGRALRPWPGKEWCHLLEFVDQGGHSLIQIGNLPGVVSPEEGQRVGENEIVPEIHDLGEDDDLVMETLIGAGVYSTMLDLLGRSPMDWYVDGRRAILGLGEGETLFIVPPLDDAGQQRLVERIQRGQEYCRRKPGDKRGQSLLTRLELQQTVADDFALYLISRQEGMQLLMGDGEYGAIMDRASEYAEDRGKPQIYRRDQRWHREPPSKGQIRLLEQLGISRREWMKLDRRGAARLLTYRFALRDYRKAGYEVGDNEK